MNTPKQRVAELAARGVVSADDRAALLDALDGENTRGRLLSLLIDPFERFGGGPAAAAGLLIACAGVAVSRLGVRFDGFFDLHLTRAPVALSAALVDQLAGALAPSLAAWAVGRLLAGQCRLLDMLGVVGLVRAPGLLAAPPLVLLARQAAPAGAGLPLLLTILVAMLALGYELTLLVSGLRNATGLRGGRLALASVLLALSGELLSKLVIWLAL